jgi:hypothetical protein
VLPPRNTAGRSASLFAYSAYAAPALLSLTMTLRQSVAAVGFTHASSVMPVVSRSAESSGTVTTSSIPSNDSARPNRPAPLRVAPPMSPSWLPLSSTAMAPTGSSKPYDAIACAGPVPTT